MVHWLDPAGTAGWRSLSESQAYPMARCVTAGWLITDEPERIVLASSVNVDEGDCADLTTLPRACIVSIHDLRKGR